MTDGDYSLCGSASDGGQQATRMRIHVRGASLPPALLHPDYPPAFTKVTGGWSLRLAAALTNFASKVANVAALPAA